MAFVFRLGNENERSFVFVFCQVAIDAVVTRVELSADKPFPERRVIGVECGVPILVPVEKFCVFAKALWKMLFAKTVDDMGIVKVRLRDKAGRRVNVFLFLPMNGDLRFGKPLFPCARFFL